MNLIMIRPLLIVRSLCEYRNLKDLVRISTDDILLSFFFIDIGKVMGRIIL
jgi:hypothetical protein